MTQALYHLVERRRIYFIASITLLLLLSSQLAQMAFNGDVKVMFDKDDPHYQRLQQLDTDYVDSNYLVILFEPADKNIYRKDNLVVVEALTNALWKLPYTVSVESISNHSRLSVADDDLRSTALIDQARTLTPEQIRSIQYYARQDQQIRGKLISPDENATALFATIALPESHLEAVLELRSAAMALRKEFESRYPGSTIHINGDVAIEGALLQVTMDDILRVNPIVFLTIFILTGLFLRSIMSIASTIGVVIAATGISTGINILSGFEMNPITMMAPAIIMVLAVADSIHVLTTYTILSRQGLPCKKAMVQSLEKNLAPVFWTSVTTAVGFLGMNFGDSPPFRTMGNMAAIGVLFAFLATFTVLPTIALLFPAQTIRKPLSLSKTMASLSNWVIRSNRLLLVLMFTVSAVLLTFIPRLDFNDDISEYFDPSLDIYESIQFSEKNTRGVHTLLYSFASGTENGVNDPDFLRKVDQVSQWLRQHRDVAEVYSYIDLIKKINQTLHNDDIEYYRIPDSKALCAQYLLLYEMLIPNGIDLSRDLTLDRSALKMTVHIKNSDNQTLIGLERDIDHYLSNNLPELNNEGSSQLLIFAHMGNKIIHSMVDGSLITLIMISIFMMIALRSVRFGLLSIIPNLMPAVVIFGIWSLLVGHVNHAAAMTFSICLGLVVDDTIHFISQYLQCRRSGYDPETALRETFIHSGTAIVITSITLSCGILLLTLSDFTVNDTLSLMLTGIIMTALLFDLLFLPTLLLWADKAPQEPEYFRSSSV
ncbi:efflux RND transporter permease subunit [Ketobacter sp.]|nr:MAG: hypothetical protein D6160_19350 [Ketobacter sp.]